MMKKALAIGAMALGLSVPGAVNAHTLNIFGNTAHFCAAVGAVSEAFTLAQRQGLSEYQALNRFDDSFTYHEWKFMEHYVDIAIEIIWKKTTPNSPKEVGNFMQSLCLLQKNAAK